MMPTTPNATMKDTVGVRVKLVVVVLRFMVVLRLMVILLIVMSFDEKLFSNISYLQKV